MRFPLPYKVGEAFRPGNADEKIRCEAGAYAWLRENCADVPIPHLYGFAVSSGRMFTALEDLPFINRLREHMYRNVLAFFGYETPSHYVQHQSRTDFVETLCTGYLLIEYIQEHKQGCMLSETWDEERQDPKLRLNLFQSLSKILLSMARKPLPRIGSFIIDDAGYLRLTNRPLTLDIAQLENEEIQIDIARDYTYSTVDSYVTDVLALHDSRVHHQPNAVDDEEDGKLQMAALSTMRMVFPQLFRRDLRRGPFVFALTDLHQSNIFVDKDWNVTCLIDLEWHVSHPIEMLHPPYWLTSQAVDRIDEQEYNNIRGEWMSALSKEEDQSCVKNAHGLSISSIMQRGWELNTFWYSFALQSPTGLFAVFYNQIEPMFEKDQEHDSAFWESVWRYWNPDAEAVMHAKIQDKKSYDAELLQAFKKPP
ncbi:MAG: hypothetical protein M1828_005116 [Chrysothrix sp. TS-e1954]|nr:MAG: hypothetical protein M1828_005116 [Chrysothrix sp. TS-e1954]